jgi:hypothetical protein
MERIERKPFQGVLNIIRFNRQYYIIAFILVTILVLLEILFFKDLKLIPSLIIFIAALSTFISLAVSYYIYDHSNLYSFNWLPDLKAENGSCIVNINAGFDESSAILKHKYAGCNLIIMDFYDPAKHTEISIERARRAYSVFPGTKTINTNEVPLNAASADCIFLILSAHEIRNNSEKIHFFKQLQSALRPNGKIIVVEHQRDFFNFIAYNLGFFHFFSKKTWRLVFKSAGLNETDEIKITPFISAFILTTNGHTS